MTVRRILYVSLFLLLAIISGCKTIKDSSAESGGFSYEESAIAIASLSIASTEDGFRYSINAFRIVPTEKIASTTRPGEIRPNDFYCFIMAGDKTITDTLHIFQPLHPRYELYDEDGSISSVVITKPETEVLIRFSYNKNIKFLGISHFDFHKNLSEPVLIPIPNSL
jgi:hypothetical protein